MSVNLVFGGSRALARLQQDGLILLENRHVTIPNEELPAEYSGES